MSFDWILQLLSAEIGIAAQAADVASRKSFSAPLDLARTCLRRL